MSTLSSYSPLRLALGLLFVVVTITGCESGGGGGDSESVNESTSQSNLLNYESIPNPRIETVWRINSDNNNLYLGTSYGIVELDKSTWKKRTLVGNTLDITPGGASRNLISYHTGLHLVGDYIYSGNDFIARTFRSADSLGGIDILLPTVMVEGCCNFDGVASNSTSLFYYSNNGSTSSDIYETVLDDFGPSTFVKTYPGTIKVIATDNKLLILHQDNASRAVSLYDLQTKSDMRLQSSIPAVPHPEPLAVNSTHAFWYNADSLFRADLTTGVTEHVNTGIQEASVMVADSQYAYVLSQYRVYRVDLSSGVAEQITPDLPLRDITLHGGKLYGVASQTGDQIYDLNTPMSPQLLFTSVGTDLPLGTTSSNIIGSGNYLIVGNGGNSIVKYFIPTGTYDFINPYTRPTYTTEHNGKVFLGHRNGDPGISTLQSDLDIRTPEILFSPPAGSFMRYLLSSSIDNGYIYWSWEDSTPGSPDTFKISKMALDGSNYELLYSSTERLGDIAIANGQIYFTCENSCGAPGWILASLPLIGGTPSFEFGLFLEPSLYLKDNILYIVDTTNFSTMQLYAANLEQQKVTTLLSGLHYGSVYLTASNNWLYVGEDKQVSWAPVRRLTRHQILDWNKLGDNQRIIDGFGSDVVGFSASSIHTDQHHLYFWFDGIKRVAENL